MDRWVILKISKDLTELTDIEGRKLEKRKEQITHFGVGEVKHEKENIDSDASGKTKSNTMFACQYCSYFSKRKYKVTRHTWYKHGPHC